MYFAVQNSISLLNALLFPLGKLFFPQLAFFPSENCPPHLPRSRLPETLHLPCGPDSKESACSVGDRDSIPGSGRTPEEGNGNPFHYSCLENFLDRGAWWAPVQSSSAQFSLSVVSDSATPLTAACQASLSITYSRATVHGAAKSHTQLSD